MIQSTDIDPRDAIAVKELVLPLTPATSKTSLPFAQFKPGYRFRLLSAEGFTVTLTGAVSIDAFIAGDEEVLIAGALTVHSVPEQLALAASVYVASGKVFPKAAAVAIAFSAGHVISADKFGVVLIQIDNAGTVTSKVPLATQAYASANAALAALPAADAGKLAIAYLAIKAKVGAAWTAITDDLTAASDLETISIVMTAAKGSALAAVVTYLSGTVVTQLAHSDRARHRGTSAQQLVFLYTSDGSGALLNGTVTVRYRPRPMNHEV